MPLDSNAADADTTEDVYSMSLEQVPRTGPLTGGAIALVRGRYKLVHYFGAVRYPDMPPLHDEFYDVVSDPTEDRDIKGTLPEIEAEMLKAIRDQIEQRH